MQELFMPGNLFLAAEHEGTYKDKGSQRILDAVGKKHFFSV